MSLVHTVEADVGPTPRSWGNAPADPYLQRVERLARFMVTRSWYSRGALEPLDVAWAADLPLLVAAALETEEPEVIAMVGDVTAWRWADWCHFGRETNQIRRLRGRTVAELLEEAAGDGLDARALRRLSRRELADRLVAHRVGPRPVCTCPSYLALLDQEARAGGRPVAWA